MGKLEYKKPIVILEMTFDDIFAASNEVGVKLDDDFWDDDVGGVD